MAIKNPVRVLHYSPEATGKYETGKKTVGLRFQIKNPISLFQVLFTNIIFIFIFFVANAQSEPRNINTTFCHADESVIFSCPLDNKKTISLCASEELSTDSGYLQYRYGETGEKPELIYPGVKKHPRLSFHFDSSHGGQWAQYELEFNKDEHLYQVLVQTNSAILDDSGVVVVVKNGNAVINTECDFQKAINRFWLLENSNIPPLH